MNDTNLSENITLSVIKIRDDLLAKNRPMFNDTSGYGPGITKDFYVMFLGNEMVKPIKSIKGFIPVEDYPDFIKKNLNDYSNEIGYFCNVRFFLDEKIEGRLLLAANPKFDSSIIESNQGES